MVELLNEVKPDSNTTFGSLRIEPKVDVID
jgi:hypothetical protein